MIPKKEEKHIDLPVTVDIRQREHFSNDKKKLYVFFTAIGYIIISAVSLYALENKGLVFGVLVFIFLVLQFILRAFIIGEGRYRKYLKKLDEQKGMMGLDTYWDILTVEAAYPYLVTFRNGVRGYYVLLEKDSIVGKPEHSDFEHYSYISEALAVISTKGVTHVHLDFSDVTSRDSRLPDMRKDAEISDNEDLKTFNLKQIEYLEWYMEGTVASYDIILFYSAGDELKLFETVREFSELVIEANYLRVSLVSSKDEIVSVASTLLNLRNFDTLIVDEVIANKAAKTNFLKVIHTIDEEGRMKKYNKTTKEIEVDKEIKKQEKEISKQYRKEKRRAQKEERKKG